MSGTGLRLDGSVRVRQILFGCGLQINLLRQQSHQYSQDFLYRVSKTNAVSSPVIPYSIENYNYNSEILWRQVPLFCSQLFFMSGTGLRLDGSVRVRQNRKLCWSISISFRYGQWRNLKSVPDLKISQLFLGWVAMFDFIFLRCPEFFKTHPTFICSPLLMPPTAC